MQYFTKLHGTEKTLSSFSQNYNQSKTVEQTVDIAFSLLYDRRTPFVFNSFLFSKKFPFFVFCSSNSNFENVYSFIENNIKLLKTTFDVLKQIKDDFKNIEKTSDMQEILKYELRLLQIITKILILIVVNELKYIMYPESNTGTKLKCDTLLQNVLDSYIKSFKDDGQPTYLIDKMILLNQKVWSICYKMNSTDITIQKSVLSVIENLEGLVGKIEYSTKLNLKSALITLSQQLICSKLHPAFSNMYRGQLYYHDTNIFDYMVDFKTLSDKKI